MRLNCVLKLYKTPFWIQSWTQPGGGQCNHLKNKRIFTLTSHKFCTSTPIPNLDLQMFKQIKTNPNSIHQKWSGLSSRIDPTIRPHTNEQGESDANYRRTRWVWDNNQLQFKASGKLLTILEEIYRIYPNCMKKTLKRCQHVTSWTWKHWDLDWLCPKITLDTATYLTKRHTTRTYHLASVCRTVTCVYLCLEWQPPLNTT